MVRSEIIYNFGAECYKVDGEAKFWLEPEVSIAKNYGLSKVQITELTRVVEDRKHDIANAWKGHFRS
jgi:hypothetical protein